MDQKYIRNFCIIAHVDHGKSTLADRLLELTGDVSKRDMEQQLLDNMELERERGITIKARAVRLVYQASDGEEYILNLIDTPGHVDFHYEVSRSLAACEGAILVVDAVQSIEAQTLANAYMAADHNLELLPVINKIDLPNARPDFVKEEIESGIGIYAQDAPLISAKNGIGIEEVLEQIIQKIPAPKGDKNQPLQALIFDSYYDSYKGVIVYVRVMNGTLRPGDKIKMMATEKSFEVVEIGYLKANGVLPCAELTAGEVGYIAASIKNMSDTRVGDTVTTEKGGAAEPLPGYRPVQPMVYSGMYPADGSRYDDLRDALLKLQLNDASLVFEPESSKALGFGFRCGFLGLLHMEIIQERLEREYHLDVIATIPGVVYRVYLHNGTMMEISNPANLPDESEIEHTEEPWTVASILTPKEYVGNLMTLCKERRGEMADMQYIDENRVNMRYYMPLSEIIYDFFDVLKSLSRGYASYDYELDGYRPAPLVKLNVLLAGDVIDAMSLIVHEENAYPRARRIAEKLKENIPRQLFDVAIQVAIGRQIIARETVKALRKDVTSKCYGGDITRKKKLLEKQKEGKKRMRQMGSVTVPQEAFLSILKPD